MDSQRFLVTKYSGVTLQAAVFGPKVAAGLRAGIFKAKFLYF